MDVVIFAGGFGSRLSEETHTVPKPMIEVGGIPLLIHIMRYYSRFNYKSFIICGGYKVDYIKRYFKNYMDNINDIELDFETGEIFSLKKRHVEWKVKILDTGLTTMTAGRLLRAKDFISTDNFFLTYGDGLSNVNITELLKTHNSNGLDVTLSAVIPSARFGALKLSGERVVEFTEKPKDENSRINGGFMVVNKNVIGSISSDSQSFEEDILPSLAHNNQVGFYPHNEFWHPMDTLRDKNHLEKIWSNGDAPWKA